MSRDSTQNNDSKDIPRSSEGEDTAPIVEVNAGIDPRQAHLNDLVKRRREERAQEEGQADELVNEELSDDHINDPSINLPNPPLDAPPEEVYFRDGKAYMRLKVDGEEKEYEASQVKVIAQKDLAADRRLAAAAAREREVQERERSLLEREAALQQMQSKPPGVPGASDDVEAQVDTALSAIYSGDEDAAKKALIGLVAGRQQPTQNADDLDRRVRQAAEAAITQQEQVRQLQSAVSQFKTEFNDIASDPELWEMADRYTLDIANDHPDYSPYQIMQEAGTRVRDWLNRKTRTANLSDRAQRKRQAMSTVPGANRPASLGKNEPPPKTRSNVLAEMKRARGQMI